MKSSPENRVLPLRLNASRIFKFGDFIKMPDLPGNPVLAMF